MADLSEKYQRETLYWAREAYTTEKHDSVQSEEMYWKACRSISCAMAFERDEMKKRILEHLLETYKTRIHQLKQITSRTVSEAHSTGNALSSSFVKLEKQEEEDNDIEMSQDDSEDLPFKPTYKQLIHGSEDEGKGDDQQLLGDCVIDPKSIPFRFSDIVGLEEAIKTLQEAIILPHKYPALFSGNRKPWRAILLYGPPGTGKTHLAKALARECNATYFSVSSADLLSKWMGQSEKTVRELFKKAQANRPSVIFIDEIDSLCSSRNDQESETARRVKTEFLVQMQGLDNLNNVFVLAATNIPWELDPAIRRRFEKRIYIHMPDLESRFKLLIQGLGNTPNNLREKDLHLIAEKLDGYSCSDIDVVCRSALMEPVRKLQAATHFCPVVTRTGAIYFTPCSSLEDGAIEKSLYELEGHQKIQIPEVTMEDFETSVDKNKSSVDRNDLERYEIFTRDYGQRT